MKERIRQRAAELGFDDCRFASAARPETAPVLQQWLAEGRHGEMEWLARNAHKRMDPRHVLAGAQSVIVVAAGYDEGTGGESKVERLESKASVRSPALGQGVEFLPSAFRDSRLGFVARYARFADYHDVLGNRLKQLGGFVDELGGPGTRSLWYVDTGPILEREFAQRAGIGFVGKHTNVISRGLGNWILLGEILTTLELAPDAPEKNRCGSCVRCLEACPTRAITAPFQLDARRCISYLTIELKGAIPVELRRAIGNRVFGCDDCLAVCPWNRFAREARLLQAHACPELAAPDLLELLALNEAEFKNRFAATPLARLKLRRLRRNVCVALGNVGDATCRPALHAAAAEPDPLVAEHARWALEQLDRQNQASA
jgi:epoxyqueuosine reductase